MKESWPICVIIKMKRTRVVMWCTLQILNFFRIVLAKSVSISLITRAAGRASWRIVIVLCNNFSFFRTFGTDVMQCSQMNLNLSNIANVATLLKSRFYWALWYFFTLWSRLSEDSIKLFIYQHLIKWNNSINQKKYTWKITQEILMNIIFIIPSKAFSTIKFKFMWF